MLFIYSRAFVLSLPPVSLPAALPFLLTPPPPTTISPSPHLSVSIFPPGLSTDVWVSPVKTD